MRVEIIEDGQFVDVEIDDYDLQQIFFPLWDGTSIQEYIDAADFVIRGSEKKEYAGEKVYFFADDGMVSINSDYSNHGIVITMQELEDLVDELKKIA